MFFVSTTQLCFCSVKASRDDIQMNEYGCIFIKYVFQKWWHTSSTHGPWFADPWHELHSDSFIIIDTSNPIGSAGSYGSAFGQLAPQPETIGEFFPPLDPIQRWWTSLSPDMDQRSIPRCGMCCFPKSKRPTRCCALFLIVGNIRCSYLSFNLEGIS